MNLYFFFFSSVCKLDKTKLLFMQALIWAAHHGHKNVVFMLLELGADKNLQTKDKKTAAEIAKINEHSEVLNFISLSNMNSVGFLCLFWSVWFVF